MIGRSYIDFCKAYHLNEDKDIHQISVVLGWTLGMTQNAYDDCTRKGYIKDKELSEFMKTIIRSDLEDLLC